MHSTGNCRKSTLRSMWGNARGMALPVALMMLVVLTIMGGAAVLSTRTDIKLASNWKSHTQTFYAAEAGLEKFVGDLKKYSSAPDPKVVTFTPPTLADPKLSFSVYSVKLVGPYKESITVSSGAYVGLKALRTTYDVTVSAAGPRDTLSTLKQRIEYLEIPMFQFGVFYGEKVNLEISPGPEMTFNGRVHSNSNLYLADGNPLKFDSFVTTTGKIYRYQNMDPTNRGKNPEIKDAGGNYRTLNFDHEYRYDFLSPWTTAEWKSAADSRFGGRVQDVAHGVEKIRPPIPDLFQDPTNPDVVSHQLIELGKASDTPEMKQAKLYYQADLRIEDGVWRDINGKPVPQGGCDPNTVTTKTFYDPREQKDMIVTEIDIGKLNACKKAPANGVLYVHKSNGAAQKGAVRLVNGKELPSQGLTVVTQNPIYVQGEYNLNNPVPAAVMADAITVLSKEWGPKGYDTMGKQVTSKRKAGGTDINAAFALGPNRESDSLYNNGGFENAIRFIEDWSGQTFKYRGSVLGLWHTQEANSDHRCCGDGAGQYYQAPKRDWGYDPMFDTKQPPGNMNAIIITKKSWSSV